VWCLVLNPNLSLEFHLQQLLPAVFTCAVARHLTTYAPQVELAGGTAFDVWSVRLLAAEIASSCCAKYGTLFPDLQLRALKTFRAGLGADTDAPGGASPSIGTVYGCVAGLAALGDVAISSVLLPHLHLIQSLIERDPYENTNKLEKTDKLDRDILQVLVIQTLGESINRL
jgi:hypothetical protein